MVGEEVGGMIRLYDRSCGVVNGIGVPGLFRFYSYLLNPGPWR